MSRLTTTYRAPELGCFDAQVEAGFAISLYLDDYEYEDLYFGKKPANHDYFY